MPRRVIQPRFAAPTDPHAAAAPPIRLSWDGRQPSRSPTLPRPSSSPAAPNLLFHADNFDALSYLTHTLTTPASPIARGLKLIYIDPPYAMQADHYLTRQGNADRLAFRDSWPTPGAYLQFMLDRLTQMHRLLDDDGVLFLHCDWRADAWLRILLEEVFTRACFRNQITWRRAPNLGRQAASRQLGRTADSILVYSKSPATPFRGLVPMRSLAVPLTREGRPRGCRWCPNLNAWHTCAPRGDYTDASIESLRARHRVLETPSGKVYIKYPLRQGDDGRWYKDQPLDTLWTDEAVKPLRHCSRAELDIGYATQKPEGLLERIIQWATREGDLVADFFCGSATTCAVAHRLGRRWIACDASPEAIATATKRLTQVAGPPGPTTFEVIGLDTATP